MATSRCRGETPLTTRPSKETVPDVIVSRPATMRSAVVLPQPDGPTSTTNSPSPTSRSSPASAVTPVEYTFVSLESDTADIKGPLIRHAAEQQAAAPVALQQREQRDH